MNFDFIMVPLVVAIVFAGVYKIFQLFVCRKERLALIDNFTKMAECNTEGKSTINFPAINYGEYNLKFNALKWGCLLFGCGLGILVGYIICITTIPNYFIQDNWRLSYYTGVIYPSCMFLFGGAGLIGSFIVEYKLGLKNKNKNSDN